MDWGLTQNPVYTCCLSLWGSGLFFFFFGGGFICFFFETESCIKDWEDLGLTYSQGGLAFWILLPLLPKC